MAFLLGTTGALAVVIAYALGVWRGSAAARRDRLARTAPAGEPSPEEKRRMREIYNFWHFDGDAMPRPSEDER
ncbi:MAG: hypothetical protein ACOYJY_00195 [Acutalibacteraceae bacterium]|jgi:hypothetical protein